MLYRQQGSVLQKVVLQADRDAILTLGHSGPWAGHLGKHKIIARIKLNFQWPGLRRDVAQFCKSCPQCQITSAKTPSRAPLQLLPIIGIPFKCIGMDIVGPVERSKAGNRYMLVITDYATKCPEVFPLKSIKVDIPLYANTAPQLVSDASTAVDCSPLIDPSSTVLTLSFICPL